MWLKLPRGLREQPAWVFIGSLVGIVGLSYLTGFTESMISLAIGEVGLHVWGGILTFAGFGLVAATLKGKPSLERLCLRFMTASFIAYTGYLLSVTSFRRTAVTIVLSVLLIGVAEIRAVHLGALITHSEKLSRIARTSDDE